MEKAANNMLMASTTPCNTIPSLQWLANNTSTM
jgi:hypothetical protein